MSILPAGAMTLPPIIVERPPQPEPDRRSNLDTHPLSHYADRYLGQLEEQILAGLSDDVIRLVHTFMFADRGTPPDNVAESGVPLQVITDDDEARPDAAHRARPQLALRCGTRSRARARVRY